MVTDIPYRTALIVGAGSGISGTFARPLAGEIGAETFAVDASDPAGVAGLFAEADRRLGRCAGGGPNSSPARSIQPFRTNGGHRAHH
jgi:NAD(P)-dependent dehydrogenase (short-subunit alcohol dehydrogenase family)